LITFFDFFFFFLSFSAVSVPPEAPVVPSVADAVLPLATSGGGVEPVPDDAQSEVGGVSDEGGVV